MFSFIDLINIHNVTLTILGKCRLHKIVKLDVACYEGKLKVEDPTCIKRKLKKPKRKHIGAFSNGYLCMQTINF